MYVINTNLGYYDVYSPDFRTNSLEGATKFSRKQAVKTLPMVVTLLSGLKRTFVKAWVEPWGKEVEKQPAIEIVTDSGLIRLHRLKTDKKYFDAIVHPDKKLRKMVEIRKFDRDYRVGDFLWLDEYYPETEQFGQAAIRLITHMLNEQPYVPEGYVALSILESTLTFPFSPAADTLPKGELA